MKSLTPLELKGLMDQENKLVLVDVREVWEHEDYNIGGQNIPLGEFLNRQDEIDFSGNTVIYCEKGIRSAIAIQRLEQKGVEGLYNLAGGMSRWKQEIK